MTNTKIMTRAKTKTNTKSITNTKTNSKTNTKTKTWVDKEEFVKYTEAKGATDPVFILASYNHPSSILILSSISCSLLMRKILTIKTLGLVPNLGSGDNREGRRLKESLP